MGVPAAVAANVSVLDWLVAGSLLRGEAAKAAIHRAPIFDSSLGISRSTPPVLVVRVPAPLKR